jgi:hypothetical protein
MIDLKNYSKYVIVLIYMTQKFYVSYSEKYCFIKELIF